MQRPELATVLDLSVCEKQSDLDLRSTMLPKLRSCGAAYLVGHEMQPGLIDNMLNLCAEIHRSDSRSKSGLDVSKSNGARGYFEAGDIISTAESGVGRRRRQQRAYNSFEIGSEWSEANDSEARILFAKNVWPEIAGTQSMIAEYIDTMWRVARRIFRLICHLIDLPADYFSCRLLRPVFQLRLIEYAPELTENLSETQVGLGAHTDYECFTLLIEEQPGLEVMARDGSWYSIVPPEGSLTLLIGDLTEVISQGQIESVLHRVLSIGMRRSCAFFVGLDPGADISSPTSGAPFRVGDHLLARTVENFPHLRAQVAAGQIATPSGFGEGNPFKKRKLERMRG